MTIFSSLRKSIRDWLPKTWCASGIEPLSGQPLSLTYIGNKFGFYTLAQRLFEPGYNVRVTSRRWLGTPSNPRFIKTNDSDLFAVEVDPHHWPARDNGTGFFIPFWVESEIPIKVARRQMSKSSSLKDDLRKVRNNGLYWKSTTRESDVHFFYEKMYRPHVLERHGELSVSDKLHTVIDTVKHGVLLLVHDASGTPVGGLALRRTNDGFRARSLGMIRRDPAFMGSGISAALYLASIEISEEHEFDKVGFGMTCPFLNDGLLQYKKKWGMQLSGNFGRGGIWLRLNSHSASVRSFLCHYPFMHISQNKTLGVYFTNEPENLSETELRQIHKRYFLQGLHSLQVESLQPTSAKLSIPDDLQDKLVCGTQNNFR